MHESTIRHLIFATVAAAGAVFVGGCASTMTPNDRVASSEAAIRTAQESGATGTPSAALHLHYAELERQEAQRLMASHDNERAAMQLRRAEADANLALALTREAAAAQAAQAAGNTNAGPDGAAR